MEKPEKRIIKRAFSSLLWAFLFLILFCFLISFLSGDFSEVKVSEKYISSNEGLTTVSTTDLMMRIKSHMPSEKLERMEATFGKGSWKEKRFRENTVIKAHYGSKHMNGYWFVKNGNITCINGWAKTWTPNLPWAPTNIQVDDVESLF
ncbi:MAG: hypothetical protein P9M02_02270 [Candidatus Susulua stagnicola]|nr:hypothetical protein [Candidatus Susulua stagnicola]